MRTYRVVTGIFSDHYEDSRYLCKSREAEISFLVNANKAALEVFISRLYLIYECIYEFEIAEVITLTEAAVFEQPVVKKEISKSKPDQPSELTTLLTPGFNIS